MCIINIFTFIKKKNPTKTPPNEKSYRIPAAS